LKATSVREAFFAVDGRRQVVMWSPAAQDILGIEAGDALGRQCWQIVSGSDVFGRPLSCGQCQSCLLSGSLAAPPAHHYLIRHRDGHLIRLVHEMVPLPPGPGARALVLLYEIPSRIDASPVAAEEGGSGSGSFSAIVKALAAVGQISGNYASSGFYQTIDSTLDRVLALTGSEAAEVFLWNHSSREMCLASHRGLFRSAFSQITRFDANQGFPGLVAASGEPVITGDVTQDPRFLRTRVKEKGMRSFISMPLRSGRMVLGCLNVASRRRLDNADLLIDLLAWIAGPLASASELAILRSQESVDLLDEKDLCCDALPGQVLKAMMDASEADQGMISMWRPGTSGLPFASRPVDLVACPGRRGGDICPCAQGSRPIVHPAPGGSTPYACRESLGGSSSAVCLPIGSPGQPGGVVSLRFQRPQPVPTRSLALLGAMARTAGRVFREARSFSTDQYGDAGPAGTSLQEADYRVFPALRPISNRDGSVSPPTKDMIDGHNGNGVDARAANGLTLIQGPGDTTESRAATVLILKPGALAPTCPPSLAIRCFGDFQVFQNGHSLSSSSFGRRQSLTVLKILVSRKGRPVGADFLLEALWPEADPEAATKRLWVVIHNLRSTLEPGLRSGQLSTFVQRNGDAYLFSQSSPVQLDVEEFMDCMTRGQGAEDAGDLAGAAAFYQQAARQYRGDFMEDEPYSDWCSAEREYLRELFLGVLKRLAWIHGSWKEWDKSIAWSRRALLVDNLREEVHRELMRSLRNAGRRDEALRQYIECRRILARELDAEPLPETSQLYEEIQKG